MTGILKYNHTIIIHPLINKPGPTTNNRKTSRMLTRLRVGVERGLGDTKFKSKQVKSPDCQVCHAKDTVSDTSSQNGINLIMKGGYADRTWQSGP